MGMSRCYSLMRCLLILFNIIFLSVGAGVCGFAAWALWDGGANEGVAARAGLCALMAWGLALTLGALASLAGAMRGSCALLAAAVALLALTAVAEAAAGWWGAAHVPQLRSLLLERLDHTVRNDYGVLHARTQLVDAIQQGLECCGANDARDWQSSAWARATVPSPAAAPLDLSVSAPATYYYVPHSCCATEEPAECETARRVPAASSGARGLHTGACGPRVLAALERAARPPLAAGVALLVSHAVALLLALVLAVRARPDHRYKA